MRMLFVGDPHAERQSLKDMTALRGLVDQVVDSEEPDVTVFSGDLYHTHAIIDAEVQYWWWEWLRELANFTDTVLIKGNHDAPGDESSRATALVTHYEHAQCVLWEEYTRDGVLFCPYTTAGQLVMWSQNHPECHTLVCHQTFDGSKYENGFYAGDGVDPNLILQDQVISGHIHSPQGFGKVWYPGAPRWRTLSDANTDRAIWIVDFDASGRVKSKRPIDTGEVCRKIIALTDTPDAPLSIAPDPRHDYRVEIRGPQSFIEKRKQVFEGWARVRATRTDRAEVVVKESEGVGASFKKWLDVYQPRYGTEKERLRAMLQERVHV